MFHSILSADLHVHTDHSDGSASVADVLAHVARRGDLDTIAITDHDTISGALEARQLAAQYGIEVVVGEEVSTADGHLLALFIHQHVPPGLTAEQTIRLVSAQGGLAIAPHPFDASVPSLGCRLGERGLCALPLDGVEVFNAGIFGPWRAANEAAARVAKKMRVAQIGGSDAHALCAIGRGCTRFRGTRASDLRNAIRMRATEAAGSYLTNGQHARQIADMLRRFGLRGFAQTIANSSRTAAMP
jgi:hypothetical protein